MKRMIALLTIPFLLAVTVSAVPVAAQDSADIRDEVENALSGAAEETFGDIRNEVENALSEAAKEITGDIRDEVENALSGTAENDEEGSDGAWTPQEVRYRFEHDMLPRYYYDVPENMLDVIRDPGLYALWESVTTENGVDPTYSAEDFTAHWYQAMDGTVIAQVELPEPEETPLCYRIYFVYNAGTGLTGYYTVEYDDFFDETSFICSWDAEENHSLLEEAKILDKESSSYEDDLMEEAEKIAELAGVSTVLIAENSSPEDPDETDTPDETGIPDGKEGSDLVGLAVISCPELGFSTMADPSYTWDYEDGTGITIYTENEGAIPYVIVYRGEDLIAEPFEYIEEQFTPYIQDKYGDDLILVDEYEDLEIGGKILPAGLYCYRVQDYIVDMLRIYDSTGEQTVAYTAKFLDGQGDETIDALDTAIRSFKAE